jgi:LAO/AO transport system kinase
LPEIFPGLWFSYDQFGKRQSRQQGVTDARPSWVPENAGPEFTTSVVPGVHTPAVTAKRNLRGASSLPADPEALADLILQGNRAALARGITLVESNATVHRPQARELLRILQPHSGNARRVGISGVPGAGKSTFIEAMGNFLCDRGHRLAVLAVDPSSSLTRGSILGDKTRMELLSRRPECFIRPSPSGGALGGVTRKTRETMLICEAAGYDLILVETVGVGQSEIAVRSMVDTFLLLLIAGAGDELQGMKKGIFEIADLIVVNKADGNNKARAEATRAEFERVLHFLTPSTEGWTPLVLTASALEKSGIDRAWEGVEKYFAQVESDGQLDRRRGMQALDWWRSLVEQELRIRFLARPEIAAKSSQIERDILAGTVAPSLAAEELLAML